MPNDSPHAFHRCAARAAVLLAAGTLSARALAAQPAAAPAAPATAHVLALAVPERVGR